jgi:hypothetical protein
MMLFKARIEERNSHGNLTFHCVARNVVGHNRGFVPYGLTRQPQPNQDTIL